MKTAIVRRDRTGWWVVLDSNGRQIGHLHDSELDAYKYANSNGYLVQ